MAAKLQQGLDLLLFGKDTPRPPRRTRSTGELSPHFNDGMDATSPSSSTQTSPISTGEKFDAKCVEQTATSIEADTGAPLGRISPWRSFPTRMKPHSTASWEPSFFHIRPLSGIVALAVAIACVFVSLIILLVSNNQPVAKWPIKPPVYLAIVTAIANSALALARAQAIPVSWWYRASRGASVRALESHWHTTNTLGGAFLYGKLSLLTAACIATSFVIIDGPLLQKASTVKLATITNDVTLHLDLRPELPTGISAAYVNHEIWYTYDGWYTVKNWTLDTPVILDVPDCIGTCKATVQAPGVVKRDCSSRSWPIDKAMIYNASASWGNWQSITPDPKIKNATTVSNPGFYVNLINGQRAGYPNGAKREGAYLTVGLAGWQNYKGAYVETSCWLNPAIVEYNVTIHNNILDFAESPDQGQLVSLANNTTPADIANTTKIQRTTIDGYTEWLSMFVNANASVSISSVGGYNASYSYDFATFNPVAAQHMDLGHDVTALGFKDPTEDVIFKYNQLMLRGGVLASRLNDVLAGVDTGLTLKQTVKGTQTVEQNVFKSDLRWYAGATVVELLTILLILPMFWGWWTLGETNYTLSPFTMALAFDSPLLDDVNSATGARGVVRELGNMQVKFGLVGHEDSRLDQVAADGQAGIASGRLGIAEGSGVVRPRKGMKVAR